MATLIRKLGKPLLLGVSLYLGTSTVYIILVIMLSSPIGAALILIMFMVFLFSRVRPNLNALREFSPTIDEVHSLESSKAILTSYFMQLMFLIATFVVECGFPWFFGKIPIADLGQFKTLLSPFVFFWLITVGLLLAAFSSPEFASAIYIFEKDRGKLS